MMDANVQSIIRAILVAGGAWLVNNGFVSAEQWQSAAGAIIALMAVAWSIYQNRQHAKVAVAATNAGVNVAAVKAAPIQAPAPQ